MQPSFPRVAVILGNGSSLREFDLQKNLAGMDSFGMNAAYRHWDRIGWYPTYYSCLDEVVGLSHKDEIKRLIDNADTYGIKGFLLRENLIAQWGDAYRKPPVQNMDFLLAQGYSFLQTNWITTGSQTLGWAVTLGYDNIILMGVDADYVEIIHEAERKEDYVLEISETPASNPNYFFDDYQRKGDRYQIPNPLKNVSGEVHLKGWEFIADIYADKDLQIYNGNPMSKVDAFPKAHWEDALKSITTARQNSPAPGADAYFGHIHSREQKATLDEIKLFAPFLPARGVMLDVGAHTGGSCLDVLKKGWTVHAFEPDPYIRSLLEQNTRGLDIHIDPRAASKVTGRQYPWYSSPDSTGVGTMMPFLPSHHPTGVVTTVTMRDYCAEWNITDIDFLKIDTEGFDYMVLNGFPFERITPRFVMCEYEDAKTMPLGNSTHDMAQLLLALGYHVFLSEWHPIIRYGIPHDWRRIIPYPADPFPDSWGNILAFKEGPDTAALEKALREALIITYP